MAEYRDLATPHPYSPTTYLPTPAASEKARDKLPANLSLESGFIIGGTSAGANFTFGIAHLVAQTYKAELLHPVTGILFLAGTICHEDARPKKYADRILSIDKVTSGPGLSKASIKYFAEQYGAPASDVRRSPLLFDSHAGLAQRAVIYVCGWDPKRDETLLVEEILRGEGVQTRKYIYPGLPHGFWGSCPDVEERVKDGRGICLRG
ncbi:hypothetical protein BJX64DRAFT_282522 [Aspergillus heterothallicus]